MGFIPAGWASLCALSRTQRVRGGKQSSEWNGKSNKHKHFGTLELRTRQVAVRDSGRGLEGGDVEGGGGGAEISQSVGAVWWG